MNHGCARDYQLTYQTRKRETNICREEEEEAEIASLTKEEKERKEPEIDGTRFFDRKTEGHMGIVR